MDFIKGFKYFEYVIKSITIVTVYDYFFEF